MNKQIQAICNKLHNSVEARDGMLDSIHITILNIKISAAKIGGSEGRALEVVATNIDKSLKLMRGQMDLNDELIHMLSKLNRGENIDVKRYEEIFGDTGKTNSEGLEIC